MNNQAGVTLPAGWKVLAIGELCRLRRELIEPSANGSRRYVGLEHLDSGSSRIKRWDSERGLQSTKHHFQAGDVLYGKLRPYLDKAAIAEWDGVCSTDILTLEAKPSQADAAFVSFLFHTRDFLAHASATTSGVNHPRTSWTDIATFFHPVPPLDEQRRIAAVLSNIAAGIEVQGRIVVTLKALKAATLARLFREGLRGEPLKQTEIGTIPKSWKLIRLGDHCEVKSGGTPARDIPAYWGGDIPWVKTSEIIYRPITSTSECITRAGLENSSARVFPKGTLLMAMYGQGVTRGKVAFLEIDAATNQACAALFPTEELDCGYLYVFCAHAYDAIRELGHGANQKNLSADLIRQIQLPLPPTLSEQQGIFHVVDSIEKRLLALDQYAAALRTLFSSLLHSLMTAKIRVPASL